MASIPKPEAMTPAQKGLWKDARAKAETARFASDKAHAATEKAETAADHEKAAGLHRDAAKAIAASHDAHEAHVKAHGFDMKSRFDQGLAAKAGEKNGTAFGSRSDAGAHEAHAEHHERQAGEKNELQTWASERASGAGKSGGGSDEYERDDQGRFASK